MKQAKWISIFALGLGAGAISGSTLAAAGVGDAIYVPSQVERVTITAPQAACFANCAISAGAWDGAVGDMIRTCAERKEGGGFEAWTRGYKTAPLAEVPLGSTVHGVVVE